MLNTVESMKRVVVIPPKDATGAAQVGTVVNLKAYGRCRIALTIGTLTGSDAMNVTLVQGTAGGGTTTATGEKALAFTQVWIDGVKTAVTSNTFAIANTVANSVYEIEVPSASLDAQNGFNCVQLKVSSPGSHASLLSADAVCYIASYQGDATAMISPLAD